MIYLYSGTPGSGKSLHIARDIKGFLRCKTIVSNFSVNRSVLGKHAKYFISVENERLTPDRLFEFSKKLSQHNKKRLPEGSILLFIDECQLLFNSREWNVNGRAKWLSFFTQHRKLGYDIILVAQFDRMIDRQIRSLIEYEYVHRKVSNYGVFGKILGFIFGGSLFVSVKVWYPLRKVLGSDWYIGHRQLYKLYDSYNLFG